MAPITNEALRKLVGDATGEVPEALYRLGADQLVALARPRVAAALNQVRQDPGRFITEALEGHVGDGLMSLAIAAGIEFLPTGTLRSERDQLAYNLRVRGYQSIVRWLVGLVLAPQAGIGGGGNPPPPAPRVE